jgi:O-antigen ligase
MSISGESKKEKTKSSPSVLSHSRSESFTGVARLLDRIVFVGLLAVIVITEIPYGTVDPWWVAVFECLVFVLCALWICEGAIAGTWRIWKLWVVLPLVIITIYVFVQTIEWPFTVRQFPAPQKTLTIDSYQTHLTSLKTLALTLFLALLMIHTSTIKRLKWLVRTLIAIGVASAVFGIMRQLLQSPTSWGFGLPFLFPGVGYAQFIGANGFAYLMEMTFALLAGLVLGGGIKRNRAPAYISAALVVWAALVLSNSRGGIVALGCQCIFLLFISLDWYLRRKQARAGLSRNRFVAVMERSLLARALAVGLIAGCVLLGVLWMGSDRLVSKTNQQAMSREVSEIDGTTRVQIWQATWRLIKDHPWSGVGFGSYFLAIPRYLIGSGRLKVEQAHDDYLDLIAGGGVVAGLLALWFMASMLWTARKALGSADLYRRAACLAALGGIVSVAAHSVVDFGLQFTGIAVAFAGILVVASGAIYPLKSDVDHNAMTRDPSRSER